MAVKFHLFFTASPEVRTCDVKWLSRNDKILCAHRNVAVHISIEQREIEVESQTNKKRQSRQDGDMMESGTKEDRNEQMGDGQLFGVT